jgi:hypothetical protein
VYATFFPYSTLLIPISKHTYSPLSPSTIIRALYSSILLTKSSRRAQNCPKAATCFFAHAQSSRRLRSLADTRNTAVLNTASGRIREVQGSSLGPETGYPDIYFVVFLSPYRQIPG